jgi:hypothetical protein
VSDLDGLWRVERGSGLLPPLYGVCKRIEGDHGETRIGPLPGVPFRIVGLTLKYQAALGGFVDLLEREGDGYNGRATFRGREDGRFRLRREPASEARE